VKRVGGGRGGGRRGKGIVIVAIRGELKAARGVLLELTVVGRIWSSVLYSGCFSCYRRCSLFRWRLLLQLHEYSSFLRRGNCSGQKQYVLYRLSCAEKSIGELTIEVVLFLFP